jgi:hypothetical protein
MRYQPRRDSHWAPNKNPQRNTPSIDYEPIVDPAPDRLTFVFEGGLTRETR